MDEEAASFKTLTLSMSFGLIIEGSPSTPSISTRADPPCPIDVEPLTLNDDERVGFPSSNVRLRLGIAPCNAWVTLGKVLFSNASEPTLATAPVKSTFFWLP